MSNNEVAVHQGSGLDIGQTQEYWTPRQLAALRQIGIQDATPGDLTVFFHQAQRTGLDPFARQIHMIKRKGKWTIQTGIDGLRLVARRAADRAGESIAYEPTLWAGPDGRWVDVWTDEQPPAAAKVVTLRDGHPIPGIALWREYVQFDNNGNVISVWQQRPAGQLAKCAEALSLRRGWPQDLSGIYVHEEMGRDMDAEPQRRVTAAVIKGEAEVDPVTGEVDTGDTYVPAPDPNAPPAPEPPGWEPAGGEAKP